MAASTIDPLDQFGALTPEQKIEFLMQQALKQQLQANGLEIRLQSVSGSLTRLRDRIEECVAMAIRVWKSP